MTLYIDYFSVVPDRKTQKYHGGGNYAKDVIDRIYNELLGNSIRNIEIEILCPMHYDISSENEPILSKYNITWINTDNLYDYMKDKSGVLYYPVLYEYRDFKTIIRLKNGKNNLKILATIHDMRMFDIYRDYTEKYYFGKSKRLMFTCYNWLFEKLRPGFNKSMLKKSLASIDKIFTDSNYSMQSILRICKKANVALYYIPFNVFKTEDNSDNDYEYMLFVSGARRVKNLARTLIAFSIFKKKYNRNIKLVITGISDERFETICDIKKIDSNVMKNDVIHYDYVSNKKLANLYDNCRFVLYLSKAEGFGLPILEAASYGKVCLTSNLTSTPEVMGSAVKYVSPLIDEDIAEAMEELCNNNILDKYVRRIEKMLEISKERINIEQDFFMEDFVDELCEL